MPGEVGILRIRTTGTHTTTISEATERAKIDRWLMMLAGFAYTETRTRAHVITGEMRDSVYLVRMSSASWKLATQCEHSKFEEYGTRYRPPHSWWGPGVDAAVRRAREEWGRNP